MRWTRSRGVLWRVLESTGGSVTRVVLILPAGKGWGDPFGSLPLMLAKGLLAFWNGVFELSCPYYFGVGVAMSTAPRQWGSVLQEFHCPLPPGSETVHCRSWSCTAHCPQAVRQCIAGVALPTAPRQCGSALREFHCPLPQGSEAVHCRSCTAHCPQAVRQCIAGVPLPTAPGQ